MSYLNHAEGVGTAGAAADAADAPVATYPWSGSLAAQRTLPEVLMEKLRARMHWRALDSVLAAPERHGSQTKLLRDACAMLRKGMHPDEVDFVLRVVFQAYYRPIDDREFERAVARAREIVERGDTAPAERRLPLPNAQAIAEIVGKNPGSLDRLRAMSPTKTPGDISTERVLDRLFPGSPLLCLASSKSQAFTEPREFFRGDEDQHPFIVPNAMSARYGTTKDGRLSPRALTNVGPRQHVVVEFDTGTRDAQAAIILHLATKAALRMVVFSGGKSLHSWFDVRGAAADDVHRFEKYAAWFGADPATLQPHQLVRMPNAERPDKGTLQEVLYLEAVPAPAEPEARVPGSQGPVELNSDRKNNDPQPKTSP